MPSGLLEPSRSISGRPNLVFLEAQAESYPTTPRSPGTSVGAQSYDLVGQRPDGEKLRIRNTKIANMDNGTTVEAFKFLNYYQLAKKSLVSKRFRNLIQIHRHSLPRDD
ncbi:hypothetical protein Ddc_13681 [Ditylenchus destructor]|nr:hypothetical protein Ddc_13681 [Ditylenchus destructor]